MVYVTLQIVNFLEAYQKNYNCDCGSTNKDNVCVGGMSIQACVKSLLSLVGPDITVMTARYVMMIVISFTTAMIAVNDVTVMMTVISFMTVVIVIMTVITFMTVGIVTMTVISFMTVVTVIITVVVMHCCLLVLA